MAGHGGRPRWRPVSKARRNVLCALLVTCTSLLHLRQLGPTDPLTTKWASLVRFISYLWQVRTDAARLIRTLRAAAGAVPHRGSRSAATVTQTTRRGVLRSRTPSPPTRSSPRSPGSPRSHASSSSGSVPGARSRAQAPPPPGQRSWRWGRQWRDWSSPTTTSLGRFRRGKKHQ